MCHWERKPKELFFYIRMWSKTQKLFRNLFPRSVSDPSGNMKLNFAKSQFKTEMRETILKEYLKAKLLTIMKDKILK